ncbi:hypothetical protein A6M13_06005 [Caryophanon tenue]|uniref:Uncharacterized protein n=1 Tax=Caryophanon tenue TaxID=33978 RepID=A0A1C0Y712_9BACL|nr:hypothetical protein A6M13_06005 [Caryophanon tenue]
MNWKRIGIVILLLFIISSLIERLPIPSYADFLHWAFGEDKVLGVGFSVMVIAVIILSMRKGITGKEH